MMKKIDILVFLFFFILSVFTLRDLFKPLFFTSHDGPHQIVRMYYFDASIADGQIPPRFVPGLLNGYGYPLFTFSYQMPWFIAEPMHRLGLSIIDSVKMTFLVGFFLSGITMYLFQKRILGRLAGFCGTFLYLFAPYRFSNIFVRAAIGDATSFIFPPLMFLSVYEMKKSVKFPWFWIIIGALSYTGLLLSHAMLFLLFSIGFGLYLAYQFLYSDKKIRYLISSILLFIFWFGLSAYYFLPSFVERNYTKFEQIMSSAILNKGTFVNLRELLYSPWGYGMMHATEGGMSFQVGLAQWLTVALSIIILVVIILRRQSKARNDTCFFLSLFFLTIFLMLPQSFPVWEQALQKIAVIDFPWRILALTVFVVSLLAGLFVSYFRDKKVKFVLGVLLILASVVANRNHLRINKSLDWDVPFYLKLEKTTNSFDEYTPKWVHDDLVSKPAVDKVVIPGKNQSIPVTFFTSNRAEFAVSTDQPEKVRVNTIYYPGWKAYVNGYETPISYPEGFMEFTLPQGKNNVNLRFTETPFREVSDIISLTSLIICVIILVKFRKT